VASLNDPEWKFQHYKPIPYFKILLEIREHWNWPDFVGGHFENSGIRSGFFLGQNILPALLNIYAKSCGNPFGSFRYKWDQLFWHMFTVSMATAAILKIPRMNGIHLPVKFSKDQIISLLRIWLDKFTARRRRGRIIIFNYSLLLKSIRVFMDLKNDIHRSL
jgi:hypothetical protein